MILGNVFFVGDKKPFAINGLTGTVHNNKLSRVAFLLIKGSGNITATIKVTNTGQREGWHTVELYTRDLYASITPSLRRLKAFKKINLKPGESKEVSFTLTRTDLSFINEKLQRVTEPGDFLIMIGEKRTGFNYVP